jgi:glycosyltransferase involved in cell wall biosynthesis
MKHEGMFSCMLTAKVEAGGTLTLKVAIVHSWFLELGGAEKVIDVLADMYPDADIFALAADPLYLPPNLHGRKIRTSELNRFLPLSLRAKRNYFMPLFPWATEGLDLRQYDLIISICGPATMGVSVRQDAVHICYCLTPERTWWDLYTENQAKMPWMRRQIFVIAASFIRMWEFNAMQRVDHVVGISDYISKRIFKYFRRHSLIIYPPVDTSKGYLACHHDDYYLSASRLVAGKRIDLLVSACNQLKRHLVIVGTGHAERELKKLAGPTIEFLGRVPDADLPGFYAKCRAFLFAADEDFGIAPVEAQAFGRPVIAYGHGGSLETVRVGDPEGQPDTGVFFPKQTVESVIDGIRRFEAQEASFVSQETQKHAQQFDTSVFVKKMGQFVDTVMSESIR